MKYVYNIFLFLQFRNTCETQLKILLASQSATIYMVYFYCISYNFFFITIYTFSLSTFSVIVFIFIKIMGCNQFTTLSIHLIHGNTIYIKVVFEHILLTIIMQLTLFNASMKAVSLYFHNQSPIIFHL